MTETDGYFDGFLGGTAEIAAQLDRRALAGAVDQLVAARERGGRVFFVGSGGGAGHASHAVCDFRKLGGFEAYTPTDNPLNNMCSTMQGKIRCVPRKMYPSNRPMTNSGTGAGP